MSERFHMLYKYGIVCNRLGALWKSLLHTSALSECHKSSEKSKQEQ